jgi:hypothetical protein
MEEPKNKQAQLMDRINRLGVSYTECPKSTEELILEVSKSNNYDYFFDMVRKNSAHKSLFFLHRVDLFSDEEEMNKKSFYLSNILGPGALESSFLELLKHAYSIETNRNNLKIVRSEIDGIKSDFKDISIYFLVSFIRENPKLIELIHSPNFDYTIMKSTLRNMDDIHFESFFNDSLNNKNLDPHIVSQMYNIVFGFLNIIERNKANIKQTVIDTGVNKLIPYSYTASRWLPKILKLADINLDNYIRILDDLTRAKLIEPITLCWCESCGLDSNPFRIEHNIPPSQISRDAVCSRCKNKCSYSAILLLDELLTCCIFSKDGFLAIYFGWLLEKEQLQFTVNNFTSKHETDFIVNDNALVECKMFKKNKDIFAIQDELENAIKQVEAHAKSLISDGFPLKYAYLIWNVKFNLKEITDNLIIKHRWLFRDLEFRVFGPDDIEDLIIQFKNK